jgi:sulfur carrier protein
MISITLNGESKNLPGERTLTELCADLGVPPTGTAVAINYRLIPRATYSDVTVRENDAVEIITATAGG